MRRSSSGTRSFAEAHFRLARLLEQQGRVTEAGFHYLGRARQRRTADPLPGSLSRGLLSRSRSRHPRSILIDGRRELIAVSPNGLIGDHVIHDTHHPTLRGYLALAGAVLRELDRRAGLQAMRKAFQLPLDPAACAAHFGMNADKWVDDV